MGSHEASKQTPSTFPSGHDLDGLVWKRTRSGRGVKGGGNRVINVFWLIRLILHKESDSLTSYLLAKWLEKRDSRGPLTKWRIKFEKMVSGDWDCNIFCREGEHQSINGQFYDDHHFFLLTRHNVSDVLMFMNVFIYKRWELYEN